MVTVITLTFRIQWSISVNAVSGTCLQEFFYLLRFQQVRVLVLLDGGGGSGALLS